MAALQIVMFAMKQEDIVKGNECSKTYSCRLYIKTSMQSHFCVAIILLCISGQLQFMTFAIVMCLLHL